MIQKQPQQQQQKRTMAVYTMGQGWTGALGRPPSRRGDNDDDDDDNENNKDESSLLIKVHDTTTNFNDNNIVAAAAGWGHTLLLTQNGKLYVSGRPHDFETLLRIHRFPQFLKHWIFEQQQQQQERKDFFSSASSFSKLIQSFVNMLLQGPSSSPSFINKNNDNDEADNDDDDGPAKQNTKTPVVNTATFVQVPLPTSTLSTASTSSSSTIKGDDNDNDVTTSYTIHNTILSASAGLSAIILGSNSNKNEKEKENNNKSILYCMGVNARGQCGVGYTSNNVWTWEPVMGLSTKFPASSGGRAELQPEHSITQVSLGLQHGVAVDSVGNLYSWGKGERGQLGLTGNDESENENDSGGGGGGDYAGIPYANIVKDFWVPNNSNDNSNSDSSSKSLLKPTPRIVKACCGMNHSAALTEDNQVFFWGKNMALPLTTQNHGRSSSGGSGVVDQVTPHMVKGLPTTPKNKVVDIACASHHVSILMQDGSVYGVGVASAPAAGGNNNSNINNANTLILDKAVEMVPPGIIDMPCRQFEGQWGADGTTVIVGKNGTQVLELSLLQPPQQEQQQDDNGNNDYDDASFLREQQQQHYHHNNEAFVEPEWLDQLNDDNVRIRMVKKGWLHTVVVTED